LDITGQSRDVYIIFTNAHAANWLHQLTFGQVLGEMTPIDSEEATLKGQPCTRSAGPVGLFRTGLNRGWA